MAGRQLINKDIPLLVFRTMAPKDNERLARIETKLDTALSHLGDHEGRIRSVEKAWWKQSAVIGFFIGAVTWFGPVLRKHVFGS